MSTSSFLEIEQTFAAHRNTEVPDLGRIAEIDLTGQTERFNLKATYFDTPELLLTSSKITLRRRTGGHDDGWHLKLPGSDGRLEISAPLGAAEDQPPEQLLDRVRAIVRRRPVVPIAQINNCRTEVELLGPDNHVLAHFCDDRVNATALLEGGEQTSWREWELELTAETAGTAVGGTILQSGTEIFAAAGAQVSQSPSKLVRALGGTIDAAARRPNPQDFSKFAGEDPCAKVLSELLSAREDLIAADPGARMGRAQAVRDMLAATREIRSLIYLYANLFVDSDGTALADDRLDRLVRAAGSLAYLLKALEQADCAHGVDRDLRVLFDEDRTGLVDKPTIQLLTKASRAQLTRARRRVRKILDTPEYLDLLDDLDAVLIEPPLPTQAEQQKFAGVLVREVKRAFIDLRNHRREHRELLDSTPTDQRELKRSCGQMLDCAQTLATMTRLARRFTDFRARKLTNQADKLSGDLQRAMVSFDTESLIVQRSRQALRNGADTFGFGVLYQAENANLQRIGAELHARRAKARKAFKRFKKSTAN